MADRTYKIAGTNPINGEAVTCYPSVTTITGQEAKPFLIQAAVDVAVDYLHNELLRPISSETIDDELVRIERKFDNARSAHSVKWNAAALFGTKTHAIAERYFSQKLKWPDQMGMYYEDDPEVFYTKEHRIDGKAEFETCRLVWDDLFRKLYKGLHDWCKKNKVVPISMEEVVYGEGYAGRYDLVCKLKDKVTMIDIKTGKGSYHDDWKPQLAAYRRAYNEPLKDPLRWREHQVQAHGFLKFNKDTERWNYKDFSDTYEIDYQIFTDLKNLWWHKQIKTKLKQELKQRKKV